MQSCFVSLRRYILKYCYDYPGATFRHKYVITSVLSYDRTKRILHTVAKVKHSEEVGFFFSVVIQPEIISLFRACTSIEHNICNGQVQTHQFQCDNPHETSLSYIESVGVHLL